MASRRKKRFFFNVKSFSKKLVSRKRFHNVNSYSNFLPFNIGTFNVHGLTSYKKRQDLIVDMDRYQLDICALQETKVKEETTIISQNFNSNQINFST